MLRSLAFSFYMALGGAAVAQTALETAQGVVSFEQAPAIIAAYDVAAIDTLAALGVPPKGIVGKLYVSYLDDVAAKGTAVGSLHEPDLEALNALQPDLTIVGGRSAKQLKNVERVSKAVDMSIRGDVVTVGLERLTAYGALFGKEAEAAKIKSALEARFAKTGKMLAGKGTALVVMTNGPKMSAYGENGRFGWLYKRLGLTPAATIKPSNHGEAISFEFISKVNPDVVLVIDRQAAIGGDGQDAKAVLDNALMHETKAWKNGGVIYLDSAAAYIAAGGVQAMGHLLDSIDAAVK